jgi:hypothetical protein
LARLFFREHDSQRVKASKFPLELETESLLRPEIQLVQASEMLSCVLICFSELGSESGKLSFVFVQP